jgi:hypothetical protein
MIRFLSLVPVLVALGCGKSHSKADVARGEQALAAALDAWKNNEPPDSTKALPDPVEYADELRQTHKLVEYTIGKADTADPAVLRIPVSLKLKDRKGKPIDRDVMFEVKLTSPILVARDPYY